MARLPYGHAERLLSVVEFAVELVEELLVMLLGRGIVYRVAFVPLVHPYSVGR